MNSYDRFLNLVEMSWEMYVTSNIQNISIEILENGKQLYNTI
jgi:hypothetical protein